MRKAAEPRCVCRRLGLSFPAENTLDIGGILIKSAALRRNLDGCAGVYLFAATLGAGVDRLISGLTALGRVSEAAAAQAAAAALIEDCCDEENERLRAEAAERGLKLRPRFSPGYGDFSIEHQRDIARELDTPRRHRAHGDGQLHAGAHEVRDSRHRHRGDGGQHGRGL